MRVQTWITGAWAVVVVAALGCAGKDKPIPVEGAVTLDGKPVAGAAVRFVPTEGSGPPAYAETQPDGSFKLTTFSLGDGALAGVYKVTVTWEEAPPPAFRDTGPASPSREDMKKKMVDDYEKRRKTAKPSPVPAWYGDLSKTPLRQRVPPESKVSLQLQSKPS